MPKASCLGTHEKAVSSIRISPSAKCFASSSADGSIYIFDLFNMQKRLNIEEARSNGINDIKWLDASDKYIFAAHDDKCIRLLDLNQVNLIID